MRISSFFYTLRQGFRNLFRNKLFTLASIATIGACLFLFGLFYAIVTNFEHIVRTAEEGVSVWVFFDEGLEDIRIQQIGDMIAKRPEVPTLISYLRRKPGKDLNRNIWENTVMDSQRIPWKIPLTIRSI